MEPEECDEEIFEREGYDPLGKNRERFERTIKKATGRTADELRREPLQWREYIGGARRREYSSHEDCHAMGDYALRPTNFAERYPTLVRVYESVCSFGRGLGCLFP